MPGSCSVSCGEGRRIRTRDKIRIADHGGTDCYGDSVQLDVVCSSELCPVDCEWSNWTWSECSVTCGNGERLGTRTVLRERQGAGQACSGRSSTREVCSQKACCDWGSWSEWSPLSDVLVLSREGLDEAVGVERRISGQIGGDHCTQIRNEDCLDVHLRSYLLFFLFMHKSACL